MVLLCLEHGAKICDNGRAMHLAVQYGHDSTLEVLIEHGFDINTDLGGWQGFYTPLFVAASYGRLSAVNILTSLGASMNLEFDHRTPLEQAAENSHKDVIWALLEAGAKMDGIHRAAFKGDFDNDYLRSL